MAFRRSVAVGFTALVIVLVLSAVSSFVTLRLVVRSSQHAAEISDELAMVFSARVQGEQLVAIGRGYLLTGNETARDQLDALGARFRQTLRRLEESAVANRDGAPAELADVAATYVTAIRTAARERVAAGDPAAILDVFESRIQPVRRRFEDAADAFVSAERRLATTTTMAAQSLAARAQAVLVTLLAIALALALALAWSVARRLVSQYQHVVKMKDAARRAAEARDDLLAMVSHDLRTPLTAVALGAALLEESRLEPEQRRAVRAVANASERMRSMIEDLLRREQLQAGTIEIARAPQDPNDLVAEAIELHYQTARERRIELRSDVRADEVTADRERLLQVFSNLIGNALKFTHANGTITIRAYAVAGATGFEIEDTGVGIPAEQVPHLFDRFFQGERRERGSIGLGLHICKRIVDAHGGSIAVESSPGRGTTFRFTIATPPPIAGDAFARNA